MANPYCSIDQMAVLFDLRQVGALSNDDNSRQVNQENLQLVLDSAAAEIEAAVPGYTPPFVITNPDNSITVPSLMTTMVATRAFYMLYRRRPSSKNPLAFEMERQEKFLDDVRHRRQNIPGLTRNSNPSLYSSDAKNGTSRFDHVGLDVQPTKTSTSRGR